MIIEPKFKQGDRVRIARSGRDIEDYITGFVPAIDTYIGKIKKVSSIRVCLDGRIGYYFDDSVFCFDERTLELVYPAESTAVEKLKSLFNIRRKTPPV